MMKLGKRLACMALSAAMMAAVVTGCSSSGSSTPANGSNPSSGSSNETYEMRLIYSYPDSSIHGKNAIYFKEKTEELTEGRVKVTLYPNNQLATMADEVNTCAVGAADAVYTINAMAATVNPIEDIVQIPFLFCDVPGDLEITRAFSLDETMNEIFNKGAEAAGFKRLGNIPTMSGAFVAANNKKAIEKPSDAAGLKIRTPGGAYLSMALEEMGAANITIAASEFPVALSQGVVDGVGCAVEYYHTANWHTTYLTLPNLIESTEPFYVNLNWWNKLPADLQDIIENQVMPAVIEYGCQLTEEGEKAAVEEIQQEPYNVQVTTWDLNDPEIAEYVQKVRQKGIDLSIEKWGDDAQAIIDRMLEIRAELGLA